MSASVAKVVSGGQTGVDRAALDVALELGLPCGGWCPEGRRAEDGRIPDRYPLRETPWWGYPQRTEWNVRDSDGTLILIRGQPDRGTELTKQLAAQYRRPVLVAELPGADPAGIRQWLEENHLAILNVAGPRESSCPGIYAASVRLLGQALAHG